MIISDFDFRSIQYCLLRNNIANSHKLKPCEAYREIKKINKAKVKNDIFEWYKIMFGAAPLVPERKNLKEGLYDDLNKFGEIYLNGAGKIKISDIPRKPLTDVEKLEVETSLNTYALMTAESDYFRVKSPIMGHEPAFVVCQAGTFEILTIGRVHKTIYPCAFYLRLVALYFSWLTNSKNLPVSANLRKSAPPTNNDMLMRLFSKSNSVKDVFAIVADNISVLVDYAISNVGETGTRLGDGSDSSDAGSRLDTSSISSYDGPRCSICLDGLNRGDTKMLNCGHSLHVGCFTQYCLRTEKRECPLCRVKF
jgi:hypothetical protein